MKQQMGKKKVINHFKTDKKAASGNLGQYLKRKPLANCY